MSKILLVDDEEDFRKGVGAALRGAGYDVREASTGEDAVDLLGKEPFDVVLTDLRMPGQSGLGILRTAALRMPDCILIVMTAFGSVDAAIEALRIGAHDFLLKPLKLEVLLRKVAQLVEHQTALAENRVLRNVLDSRADTTGLIGTSRRIEDVKRLISRVAGRDSTVLIVGETGTGKELVARALHRGSPRSEAPFIAINCGSIPETLLESELFGHVRGAFTGADRDKRGLFEVAGGGTILLDEIGEMPYALQAKLLRALEHREILRVGSTAPMRISARIVAATHRNLLRMSEEGTFRSDLYYRLAVFEIPVPPLRERREDVHPIATHLLERFARRMNRPVPALTPAALKALESYSWPGNVRELANVLERALILTDGPRIGPEEFPGVVIGSPPMPAEENLRAACGSFEAAHIRRVLDACRGDKSRTAEALGIGLSSLYRKLEEIRLIEGEGVSKSTG